MDRLYEARQRAINANQDATATAREYHDRKAEPHHYHRDQLVPLQDPYYLNRNAKITPKWTGPHQIEQLKGDWDVSLKLASGRKLTAHVNRLKPYHQNKTSPRSSRMIRKSQLRIAATVRPKTSSTDPPSPLSHLESPHLDGRCHRDLQTRGKTNSS